MADLMKESDLGLALLSSGGVLKYELEPFHTDLHETQLLELKDRTCCKFILVSDGITEINPQLRTIDWGFLYQLLDKYKYNNTNIPLRIFVEPF